MKNTDYMTYPEGYDAVAETFDFIPEEERREFLFNLIMMLLTEAGE